MMSLNSVLSYFPNLPSESNPPGANTMRMSTKGRFAVNAIIDLALREGAGPVALASIGERQRISLSYLEQLFSRLRKAGIVESTRGPGGGYTGALWQHLNAVMLDHMRTITLDKLVSDQVARGVTIEPRPARRAIAPQPVVKPVRTTAPNSVFAFGRSFSG